MMELVERTMGGRGNKINGKEKARKKERKKKKNGTQLETVERQRHNSRSSLIPPYNR
jgi:hypothetical protein